MLDIGPADFGQRANAIVEGEKAATALMPQIRERITHLRAERIKATQLAQQKAEEVKHQECLKQRSSLQKIAGLAGMSDACDKP